MSGLEERRPNQTLRAGLERKSPRGCDHTSFLHCLCDTAAHASHCASVKDFHEGEEEIRENNSNKKKITQTFSRPLFSESGAGNERRKIDAEQEQGRRVGGEGEGRGEWAVDQ